MPRYPFPAWAEANVSGLPRLSLRSLLPLLSLLSLLSLLYLLSLLALLLWRWLLLPCSGIVLIRLCLWMLIGSLLSSLVNLALSHRTTSFVAEDATLLISGPRIFITVRSRI